MPLSLIIQGRRAIFLCVARLNLADKNKMITDVMGAVQTAVDPGEAVL